MADEYDNNNTLKEIKDVIHNSIGWAKNKDKDLLYSCFADDSNLFYFNPDNSYILGREAFESLTENFFLNPGFKAISYEIKELRINLSESETVAWWSCRLDDRNEWNMQPANWINVRWSGVIEKRNNNWVIVQMHFSNATGTNNEENNQSDSTKSDDK